MPPKKAGKKKGGKKKDVVERQPTPFDHYTLEQLQETLADMTARLDQASRDRNQMQIDRDTVQRFFDISRQELEEAQLSVLSKEREMENCEENHHAEVRVYTQKVRHLEYEHSNTMREVVDADSKEYTSEQQIHLKRENDLRRKKESLRQQITEQDGAQAEETRSMKTTHEKYVHTLRQAFDRHMKELQDRYESRLSKLIHDLELRRKVELHEVEERKNQHINDLLRNHERQFMKMKDFYNDITRKNLKTISDLKAQIKDMNEKQVANQALMVDIAEENKRLADPLTVATAEVQSLKADLRDGEKDRLALKNARARTKGLGRQHQMLLQEHREAEETFERLSKERDELYERFEDSVKAVQERVEQRNRILEDRLDHIAIEHDSRAAQLQSVLEAAQLDPAVLNMVNQRLDAILDERNRMIKDLHFQVTRVTKSHNDALRVYEAKLEEMGIDTTPLGHRPLPTTASLGPAGLVAQPAFS